MIQILVSSSIHLLFRIYFSVPQKHPAPKATLFDILADASGAGDAARNEGATPPIELELIVRPIFF